MPRDHRPFGVGMLHGQLGSAQHVFAVGGLIATQRGHESDLHHRLGPPAAGENEQQQERCYAVEA